VVELLVVFAVMASLATVGAWAADRVPDSWLDVFMRVMR
jgi:hypothetical protein